MELHFQDRVTVFSNRILVCVSKQLRRLSASSYFQSALVKLRQPFSVMSLMSECRHSYWGITFLGAASFPSPVARNPYLWYSFSLTYLLITEVEKSQLAEVGSAEDLATLLSDAIVHCIYPLLLSHKCMSPTCFLSFPSTSLRTTGRSSAEIFS